MKIKLSVPEFLQVCKAIRLRPERIFKMIRKPGTHFQYDSGGGLSLLVYKPLGNFWCIFYLFLH